MTRKTSGSPRDDDFRQDTAGTQSAQDAASRIRDSAQQIWLAGLGAFAKAQAEGGKVFDSLVREGADIQRKTQAAAQERLQEATSRMSGMASEFSSRASGEWDRLGALFEDRVARALQRLGVPGATDLAALQARIDELEREVASLKGKTPAPRAPRKRAASAPGPDKP